jgi:zinc transporter ZupT
MLSMEVFMTGITTWVGGCSSGSPGLLVFLLLDEALQMFVAGLLFGLFVAELFSRPLLGWHLMGVLSSSQMVGANVGVRLLEAFELQRERKMELE